MSERVGKDNHPKICKAKNTVKEEDKVTSTNNNNNLFPKEDNSKILSKQ